MTRIGLIGFGFIGANVYRRISEDPSLGLEIAFVHARRPEALAEVPRALVLDSLEDFAGRRADLIVEAAHPGITRALGAAFLTVADYLPLSVTALADAAVEKALLAAAEASGHRLFIPHGALVGVDNLHESRAQWRSVTITFEKHPRSLDFSESGIDPASITERTVVYDGPVRGVAHAFPRNVNTMVTCALATVGLDACRGVVVADPALDVGIADVRAEGHDGSLLASNKRQPMAGVSGTEMFMSSLLSIQKAAGGGRGLQFV